MFMSLETPPPIKRNISTTLSHRKKRILLLLASLLYGVVAPLQAADSIPEPTTATANQTGAPTLQPHLVAAQPTTRADEDYYSVTVDDAYIELHTGPGRGYPVFHVVERGELIHLHKRRTDWIKLSDRWHKKSGWAKRSDLNHTIGLDGTPLRFTDTNRDDYLTHRWESGVALGDFKGAESLTVNLGYRLTRNLSSEVRISQSTGQFSDNTLINAALVHQAFPHWQVSPFFMLGVGVINTQAHATLVQSEDSSDTAMLIGAGAYIYLSHRFVMRFEYNNHLILTSRKENEEINEWKLGLNVFF